MEAHEQPTSVTLDEEDHRRVRLGLTIFAATVGVVALGQLVMATQGDGVMPYLHAGVSGAGSAFALIGLQVLRRRNVARAVLTVCLCLLPLTIVGTFLQQVGPVVASGPLVIFALGLPFVRGAALKALTILTAVVVILNLCIAAFADVPPLMTGVVPERVVFVVFAALAAVVTLFLLNVFSNRAHLLRMAERHGRLEIENLSEMVRAVIEASPIAIAVLNLEGDITLWNPAATTLFGLGPSEVHGRKIFDAIDTDGTFAPNLKRLAKGESLSSFAMEAGAPGKTRLPLDIAAAPIHRGGDVSGYVVMAEDISARRTHEAELAQAQKMESVGLLAGGIAHDFNNLLTVIVGETSLLDAEQLGTEGRESVRAIADASSRAKALCRQLLTFSRRQIVQPTSTNLAELLVESLPLFQRMIGARAKIAFRPPATCPSVLIDPNQFTQVILNLILNASDAMPSGGVITVTISSTTKTVDLTFKDTGTGMAEDVAARAFEPFFTTKPVGEGTGLGLATVWNIVTGASGTVTLTSSPGNGTEFRLSFPSVTVDDSPGETVQVTSTVKELRVLIVDDDPAIREIVRRMVVKSGHQAVVASNAENALALVQSNVVRFDMLISDVLMPGMNGRQLAERFRELSPTSAVMLMSGYANDKALAENVDATTLAFLPKPFTRTEFAQTFARALALTSTSTPPSMTTTTSDLTTPICE